MRPLLGTYVAIGTEGAEDQTAVAVDAAFDRIEKIHRLMSFHDPASELSRLNRDAFRAPQTLSPPVARVLCAALGMARASEGRFDPTVAGRLVASGLLPSPAGDGVDVRARWSDVHCLPDRRVRFAKPLWLDFGGIAKGYAVDLAVRALWQHGIRSGIVNAGGDLRVFGAPRHIDVRDPADPGKRIPLLEIRDGAVATSAGYFSTVSGRSALIDTDSGDSMGLETSVTVSAPRAIWADALTKVVLACGAASIPLLRRLHAQAIVMTADGHRQVLQ